MPLRVLKHHSIFLSTFEDPARDPTVVQKVSVADEKDDNLFPSRLPPPSGVQYSLPGLDSSEQKRYGYPICWSQKNYEWYPYLPAVVDFRYPIFRGMSRVPNIVHGKTGYRLNDEQMALWQNVEFVMLTVSKAIGSGQLVSLDHREPEPPSSYGYTLGHARPEFAKKCAIKSLNAFQRLLGYCAYSLAGAISLAPLGPHARFFSDTWVSDLYKKLDTTEPNVHILTKLLLSTLWKMRSSGNHTGVVVAYEDDYDYLAVKHMVQSNVPVYVAWPGPNVNPYTKFHQHHHLSDFLPKPEDFEALERIPTPQPAIIPTLPTIRYGIPSTSKDERTYDHPMDYIKQRLQQIPGQFERSTHKQVMLDRLASARRAVNLGGAKLFRFDSVTVVDQQTGQNKECWTRTLLSEHDAREWLEDSDRENLWFDHVLNQWNYSDEFRMEGNEPSTALESPSEGMDVLESREVGASGQLYLDLEEGEMAVDSNEPFLEETVPTLQEASGPRFDEGLFSRALLVCQPSNDADWVDGWSDVEEFLRKRYGLLAPLGQEDHGRDEAFCMRLGLPRGPVDILMVDLFESFVNSSPLPRECDLSTNCNLLEGGQFPHHFPNRISLQRFEEEGYLVTVGGGTDRPWKLLIKDPITVIQIEREGWHLHCDSLVLNLVRKGLPFEILYPSRQEGTVFYPHPGPVVHPAGRSPTQIDYLAYRLDVADFFNLYPHAHAAALCAGGILWRVAMDVSPLPNEHEIARPFHPDACLERTLDGQRYWTPKLTELEKEEIVGVFKWAVPGQSNRHDSWWPKPTAWASSGLDFGAWSPADEAWYSQRKKSLADGVARAIKAKDWKSSIKFQRTPAANFLAGARSVSSEFILEQRL